MHVNQNLAIPEIHASRVLSGDRLSPPARTSLPSEHWRWQHCSLKSPQALKVQKIAKHWTLRPPGTVLELLALLRLVNPKTIWNSAFSYKRLQDPASSQSTGPRRLLPVKPLLGGGGLPVIPQTSIWHVLATPSHSSSPTLEPKLRCRWVNFYHNVPDMTPYRFLVSGSCWFLSTSWNQIRLLFFFSHVAWGRVRFTRRWNGWKLMQRRKANCFWQTFVLELLKGLCLQSPYVYCVCYSPRRPIGRKIPLGKLSRFVQVGLAG